MILRRFISLRAFTVYMEKSLQPEISLWSNWPKWNLHRCEFHFAWTLVNAKNKVTLHQSEILPRGEISNLFEFTCLSLRQVSYKRALTEGAVLVLRFLSKEQWCSSQQGYTYLGFTKETVTQISNSQTVIWVSLKEQLCRFQ